MAELLKSKRVFFPLGKQREFLLQSKDDLRCTWKNLAEISGISVHNLAGWRNEKNSMSLLAIEQICKKRNVKVPRGIVIKDAYWYVKKGAKAGGKAIVKKYGIVGGDQEYRKKKWREWWEKEGKSKPSKITQALPFKEPIFSEELAEFVGIMLGDGGISKYQFTVTLHRITDKKYSLFVRGLIKKLFNIQAGKYCDRQFLADSVVVSRIGIVKYCIEELGLKKGNKVKQQVDIPLWVKENRQYLVACLRGLIDTDGCIILHQYISKGKRYCYKKIGFTSRSYPLLKSVSEILLILGIKHRIMKNGWDIRIEARKDVEMYFVVVGTHNPKHWKRYKMA
jgi:hypothetical protein